MIRSASTALSAVAPTSWSWSEGGWFPDRAATHILAFEGDSKVTWFEGNYQAYHEQRRKLLGDAADRPRRAQFRPVRH